MGRTLNCHLSGHEHLMIKTSLCLIDSVLLCRAFVRTITNMFEIKSTQSYIPYWINNKQYPLGRRYKKIVSAGRCFERISLVCKFCGIAPAFTELENVKWKRLCQTLNGVLCIGFVTLYAWLSIIFDKGLIGEQTNSIFITAVVESMSRNYYLALMFSVVRCQTAYRKTKQIFKVVDEMDDYLVEAVAIVDLNKITWFLLVLGLVPQHIINFVTLGLVKNRDLYLQQYAIIFSVIIQMAYPFVFLGAILAMIAVLIKFHQMNQMLR